MAQTIKLKNSGTSSNTPSSLEHGELAINYADGKIFYKNSSNSIVEFANLSGSFLPLSGGTLTGGLTAPSLTVDNITIDGNEIDVSSGNLTLDVAGDIILDADGGDIRFSDGGTQFGIIFKSGNDLALFSNISNGDLLFRGNDGGANITALTLDMSNAGAATFNNNVTANRVIVADGIQDTGQGGSATIFNESGSTADFRVESNGNTHMLFVDGGSNRVAIGHSAPATILDIHGTSPTLNIRDLTSAATGVGGAITLQGYTSGTGSPNNFGKISGTKASGNVGGVLTLSTSATNGTMTDRMTISESGAATFNSTISSGAITASSVNASGGFLNGSNGGIRVHTSGTKFFNVTAANVARDNIMDIGAADARFKNLHLGGTISSGAITSTGLTANGATEINSTAAIPLKIAYNNANYMAIGHEFTDVVSGGVGHIFKISGTQKMLLSASGLDVTGSAKITGSASANTSAITMGFTAPDGEIKVKNTTGAPASNLDFYTTNSSGTTAIAMRLTDEKDVSISRNLTMNGTLIGASSISCGTISSGAILATANDYQFRIKRTDNAGEDWRFLSWSQGLNIFPASNQSSTVWFGRDGGNTDVSVYNGSLKIGTTTVIDASRNLTNIGTISSGAITVDHTDGTDNISLTPTSTGGVINTRNSSGTSVVVMDGRGTPFIDVAGNLKTGGTTRIDSSGNLSSIGTISSGAITSTGLTVNATGSSYPTISHSNGNRIQLQPSYNYYNAYSHIFSSLNGTTNHLTIANTGNATFSGSVTANAGVTVDTINIDGNTIATSSGNFFIDSASDIFLDADGGNVFLRDNGTNFGNFNHNGSNLRIDAKETNGNIHLNPNGTGSVNVLSSLMVGSTTAPRADLHISGNDNKNLVIQNTTYQSSGQNTEVGLRFKATAGSDDERAKAGIILKNDGSAYGRGDLHFVVDSNDDNGNAEVSDSKMVITHEGRVGIGTFSPDEKLDITGGFLKFNGGDYGLKGSASLTYNAVSDHYFQSNGSTKVIFKANGNLLIGKTADNNSDVGIRMQSTGHTSIVKSGGNCLTLNRLSTDGSLLDFRKDTGTLVGSIGTGNSGNLYIGSGDAGINFNKDVNSVYPINVDTGGATNGTLDLGLSAYRFKDGYFSGNLFAATGLGVGTTSVLSESNVVSLQIGSSSVAASQLVLDDNDSNGPWKIRSNQSLIFYDNTSERLRIDSSGNFLVGTSSTIPFTFSSGTGAGITNGGTIMAGATAEAGLFNRVGSDGAIIQLYKAGGIVGSVGTAGGDITIGTGDTGITFEDAINVIHPVTQSTGAARDNAVDLGKTAARFKDAHFAGTINTRALTVENDISGDAALRIKSTSGGDPIIYLNSSAANRSGLIRYQDNGVNIGRIEYVHNGDRIDMRAGSATGITMSVVNSGVMIGSTTPSKTLKVEFSDTNTSTTNGGTKGLEIKNTATATNTYAPIHFHANQSFGRIALKNVDGNEEISQFEFIVSDDGSAINAMTIGSTGNVTITGSCTATSFPTSSDARLKDNIEDAKDSGEIIDKIKVRQFDWKKTGKHQDYGMIAQELILECPDAVSTPTEDHEMMGVDYSKLVPLMMKEIQNLRKEIKSLKEKE
tara:strand:+ start:587 stop:5377 length:4791 start_codon:yes stop_codon:yes gene_type:complete